MFLVSRGKARRSEAAPNKDVNTICLPVPAAIAAEKSSTFSDDLFAGPGRHRPAASCVWGAAPS